jgi:hypothetical protein
VIWSRGFSRWFVLVVFILTVLMAPLLLGREGQPTVQAASCWKAEITEQRTDVDLVGSVLRVSVQGKVGLPVVIRSIGSFQAIGFTGTKPEYGPFVAEFAPLSLGTYYIAPEGLGTVFEVWLDGKNFTRVDFTPLPCAATATPTPRPPTATPRVQATATRRAATTAMPTPQPAQPSQPVTGWHGRVAQRLDDLEGRYFATIAVRVIGRPAGQEIEIRSQDWTATCKTGTKPEHGPDACEFGALNSGTYRLTPKDLGTHLDVTVGLQDFVLIEFSYTGPSPRTRWVGSVVENTSGSDPTEHANSAVAVRVAGKPWHKVEIRSDGWSTTCITGYKPDLGPDACEFGGLRASTYTITPQGLDASAQVTVDGWGWAMVRFDEVSLPPPQPTSPVATAAATKPAPPAQTPATGPTVPPQPSPTPRATGWQGWVLSNTSGQQEGTGIWSVIVVRVVNRPGVQVNITGGGGWSATCLTGTKPEYGPDACEFGGLWPGIYRLQPQGADIQLEVEMDGLGAAFVEFASP